MRYGLGLVQALVGWAIEVGRIRQQPVEPLSHVLIGALDEAALYVAQSGRPDQARGEVFAVLEELIAALAIEAASSEGG
jgi:hypothetical protein